jgi:pyruvate/2-oxoglutarate dehydrogenase complex dihydrolipoamide acyltransferase (E2) component
VENKEDVAKFKDYSASAPAAPQAVAPKSPAAEEKRSCPASLERPQSTADLSFAGAGRVLASPLAKKTAAESNVDLKGI